MTTTTIATIIIIALVFGVVSGLAYWLAEPTLEDFDKKAEFNVSGEDIFLDNRKLELIFDALTHILRNSIDHGIETIEKRKEKSKAEHGTISIKTKEENNHFEIFIVDDGNGIDGERVMTSAVKKGALAKEKADAMSDEEKVNLIFLPNLSTADSVSDISGRGVGMDVVKSNIEKIGGKIKVSSILGTGTIFKITFPFHHIIRVSFSYTITLISPRVLTAVKISTIIPFSIITKLIKCSNISRCRRPRNKIKGARKTLFI